MNRFTDYSARSVLIAFSMLLFGCDDEEEQIARLPLRVYSIEHPDSLPVGHADTLEVGAMVGYDRCTLENGGIEQRSDSLIVRGNALCRDRKCRDCPLAGPSIVTAPSVANPQWLRFPLPNLAPGRYFIVAGDLLDTLIVTNDAGTPQRRFSGIGQLLTSACPVATFQLTAPFRRYELDLPTPIEPANVELHGTLVGPATCDTTNSSGTLHVRSMIPSP